MQPTDLKPFQRLLTDALAYYGKDATKFTLDVWWNACQQFDLEQVSKALTAHAMDPERGQFAPKVADIIRVLAGTSTDRASLAWGKVLEAAQRVGAYQDVVFDDPAIHAAVEDCGGWPKLCRTDLKELGYLQHRFCESHKAYTGRGSFEFTRRLAGDRSPDAEYEKKRLPLPQPVMVGDVDRCRDVLAAGGAGKTAITFSVAAALPDLRRAA